MLGRLPIIALILAGTTACDGNPLTAAMGACTEELRSLKDPTMAANKAVSLGDLRLIAIKEYARWTPGAPDPRLRDKHGVIVLEKTSDTPADGSCERYQVAATAYAENYNRRVIELTVARRGSEPSSPITTSKARR
jgi:hypothetical protein